MYCFFILLFSFDTSFTAGLKLVLGLGLANLRVRVTFQKVNRLHRVTSGISPVFLSGDELTAQY